MLWRWWRCADASAWPPGKQLVRPGLSGRPPGAQFGGAQVGQRVESEMILPQPSTWAGRRKPAPLPAIRLRQPKSRPSGVETLHCCERMVVFTGSAGETVDQVQVCVPPWLSAARMPGGVARQDRSPGGGAGAWFGFRRRVNIQAGGENTACSPRPESLVAHSSGEAACSPEAPFQQQMRAGVRRRTPMASRQATAKHQQARNAVTTSKNGYRASAFDTCESAGVAQRRARAEAAEWRSG